MRIVMMGTGTFAEPTFEALIQAFPNNVVGLITQPDRESGQKRGSTRQTGKGMATIARASGVAVAQPESINAEDGLGLLRALQPGLVVVAAYGQILSKDVLAVPSLGTINVHGSLLPKYRGAAPVAHAILAGEERTGVTIIKVTPGLDSGDVILDDAIDILPRDTTGTLEARLADVGARLAVEAVRKYASGTPVLGRRQDPARVSKAPKIKKEFGLVDWHQPSAQIERHVRAMQPWPTAFTFLHRAGRQPLRIILHSLTLADVPSIDRSPGTPYRSGDALLIATGGCESVAVQYLQPAGKNRLSAGEFLRGYPIVDEARFGGE